MTDILQHLANSFRASAAGKAPGRGRDFTIDYESFLRRAGCHDGDARELAERDLAAAAGASGGMLGIDRHPRSHLPTVIRLARDGGEAWLFTTIGQPSPSLLRRELADFFEQAAGCEMPVQWRQPWQAWCGALAESALGGRGVQPFRRNDPEGNRALLSAITGVLNWRGPSLVRYASAAITGDSKQLQALEGRVLMALQAVTGRSSLEDFGIFQKPRFVTIHGPLTLTYADGTVDCGALPGPVALAGPNISRATAVTTSARLCLTVENEDTFHALAAAAPAGVLLVLTSYAGSATRALLASLPLDLRWFHFGDADPAGSDILRDLREKSGRKIEALPVTFPPAPKGAELRPFTATHRRMLRDLMASDLPESARACLEALDAAGGLRAYEQELIPIPEVLAAIESVTGAAAPSARAPGTRQGGCPNDPGA